MVFISLGGLAAATASPVAPWAHCSAAQGVHVSGLRSSQPPVPPPLAPPSHPAHHRRLSTYSIRPLHPEPHHISFIINYCHSPVWCIYHIPFRARSVPRQSSARAPPRTAGDHSLARGPSVHGIISPAPCLYSNPPLVCPSRLYPSMQQRKLSQYVQRQFQVTIILVFIV